MLEMLFVVERICRECVVIGLHGMACDVLGLVD